jgi:hypothetical protein
VSTRGNQEVLSLSWKDSLDTNGLDLTETPFEELDGYPLRIMVLLTLESTSWFSLVNRLTHEGIRLSPRSLGNQPSSSLACVSGGRWTEGWNSLDNNLMSLGTLRQRLVRLLGAAKG